ncbi:MOSC domain-containing protein [Afipia sp. TerB]
MPLESAASLAHIFRYPVKGLSPEPLEHAELWPGKTLLADRRYAIENGPIGFDPAKPAYYPKTRFLMLMRNERLAGLRTRFDDASNVLTVGYNGAEAAQGDLETMQGRAAIEDFFAANFKAELKGPPKILSAPGHSFSDVAAKVVSIINLASLAAIEDIVGKPVDPRRFRANLYVSGWPAWRELDLMGKTLKIGATRLKTVKDITRCAAVNVDPVTAERDLNIPDALMRSFGHINCGIYTEVTTGGTIAAGDSVTVED